MNIRYIDQNIFEHKKVLLRVDFNVTLKSDFSIADDFRIARAVPTIEKLLASNNILIILSHLGKPKGRDPQFSLKPVVADLQKYLPNHKILLVQTLEEAKEKATDSNTIIFLENVRFFEGENKNDPEFSKQLASLADIYVNDAFGVCHREVASVVGIPKLLPSYGGLLLKKEIEMLDQITQNPEHPVVAIMGGAKVSTKIQLISRLAEIADHLLVGGGLANTFFAAKGYSLGTSFYEKDEKAHADNLLKLSDEKKTELVLPVDVIIGDKNNPDGNDEVVKPDAIKPDETRGILDIGPETEALWSRIINNAKTIVWNGPVGYIEHPVFRRGTDFLYYAITQNSQAVSVVGGGETLTAISKKEYLDKITHISTGGGAMLEYIEKGTLAGIEELKNSKC
jgi:phosphoglycerate kinase